MGLNGFWFCKVRRALPDTKGHQGATAFSGFLKAWVSKYFTGTTGLYSSNNLNSLDSSRTLKKFKKIPSSNPKCENQNLTLSCPVS